jgi:hypothetical protein
MCGCREGFQMISDSATNCEDIDECELQIHNCQQDCSNTEGSYVCSCRAGYELADDEMSCTAREECANTVCSHFCAVVSGNPICSCPNGYVLSSDSRTCSG